MGERMKLAGETGLQVIGSNGHSVIFQGLETPVFVVEDLVADCLRAGAVQVPAPERAKPAKVAK